jgi:uncharacterized membrane protein YjdF
MRVIYHIVAPHAAMPITESKTDAPVAPRLARPFEIMLIAALLMLGALFLLRMAYLPIWITTPVGMVYVAAVTWFIRRQYGLSVPLILPLLAVLAVSVDGLGNYFGWYRARFRWIQYDEIAHALIPLLIAPSVIWLFSAGINKFGWRLPLGLVTYFAATTMFTISGFYEVIELWDDKYMHPQPGMRIHGPYDTANDLQWDLIGIVAGCALTYFFLKRSERAEKATNKGAASRQRSEQYGQ